MRSYPQNLCISMWTEGADSRKRRAAAEACVTLRAFRPVRSTPRLVLVAAARVEHRGRDAVAPGVLAAIEGGVGNLQDTLGKAAFTGGHAVESAQSETRGHRDALAVDGEGGLRDAGAQLACGFERVLIGGLGQHHRKFLAADARHPVDAAPQILLQARTELAQDLIAAVVTERVIDGLEQINVAKDERERTSVAHGALHLAREMLAEETPAGDARQIIGRG